MNKTCRTCNELKPLEQFYRNSKSHGGYMVHCKACFRASLAAAQKRPPRHQTSPGMKRCTLCKETKPEAEFTRNKNFHDGLDRACKACARIRNIAYEKANREKLSAAALRRYHADPERYAEYGRKKNYGMERGEYARMLAAQEGRCAICGIDSPAPRRHFHVDHCHNTGVIRGLLCGNCNTGIGHLQHSRVILVAAMAYLSKTTSPEGA